MEEEIEFLLESTTEQMQQGIGHLQKSLATIHAGKASPSMLSGVMVNYYGSQTPLEQVASVNTTDAQTIRVQPWEKPLIPIIEKAILTANLGFTPMNNGEQIIITIPLLTRERRKELVKKAKSYVEKSKVSLRSMRRDALDGLKKIELSDDVKKDIETEIQELTDTFIAKTETIFKEKETNITTV